MQLFEISKSQYKKEANKVWCVCVTEKVDIIIKGNLFIYFILLTEYIYDSDTKIEVIDMPIDSLF